MKRGIKRRLAGIVLAFAMLTGLYPNMPLLAENEELQSAYDTAVETYWEAESAFCTAVDNYYGNEENGTEGVLPKYYEALDNGGDNVDSLYNTAMDARSAVITAYEALTAAYSAVNTEYDKLAEEEKSSVEESYNDITSSYAMDKQCHDELEIPESPAVRAYYDAENEYWEAESEYWKAVDFYYGNEETGQKGALEKYDEAREEGKDVAAVLKFYEAALDARNAVISSYENLTKKYEIVQEKYQALSAAEKEKIENHDEIGNAYADAKNGYDTLETPEPLAVSQKPAVQTSGNLTKITLYADTAEILGKINLTEAEKRAICDGDSTDIILNVADAEPTTDEKNLIKEKLGDYTIGQYMNMELLLKVGNTSRKITDMTQPVRISITIPDSLLNKDTTKKRTYSIIRIHNGAATVIDGTYDASSGTLTFDTDRFSIYTLVYKDEKVSTPSDTTNTTPVTNPSDTTNPTSTTNTAPASNTATQAAGQQAVVQQAVKTGDHTPITEMWLLFMAAAVAAGVMGKRVVRFRKQR